MSRQLDPTFISDLLSGTLKHLLEYIKNGNTLDLEIRENCINIYYRGGNALKVNKKNGGYELDFDIKYLAAATFLSKSVIKAHKVAYDWNLYFPLVKQAMDFYITKHSKEERESQQLVVRENNYSSAGMTTSF